MSAKPDEALINLTSTPFNQALVSVIIPAKDAAATLDRTLWSVRRQTYRNLEIIVVNDGSSDDTASLVKSHAQQDARIRLISNPVCIGVGGSRNLGAANASGDYLAFIDADDLMAPESVSARVARLRESGAGLCYCWSAIIDGKDRIINARAMDASEGEVFLHLLGNGNFLGNGSCAVVTRAAFDASGGYSDTHFAVGVQGCEDYQFYLDAARHCTFACVAEFLIGSRETPGNMSSNENQMLRSMAFVQADLLREFPEHRGKLRYVRNGLLIHIAMKALRARQFGKAIQLFRQIGWNLPSRILRYLRSRIAGRDDLLPVGSPYMHVLSELPGVPAVQAKLSGRDGAQAR